MAYDNVDFLYYDEKLRELMGKSGFSNLGKVKKHFEENWS